MKLKVTVVLFILSLAAPVAAVHLYQKCLDTYHKNGGANSRSFSDIPPGEIAFLCKVYGHDAQGVVSVMTRESDFGYGKYGASPIFEEYVTTTGNVTLRFYSQNGMVFNHDDKFFYDHAMIKFVNGLAVEVSLSRTGSVGGGKRVD